MVKQPQSTSKGRTMPDAAKPFMFKKGRSGNPGGMPKKFRTIIRETTKDGEVLVNIMRTIAEGEKYKGRKPTLRDIMDAVRWLADHGFGKAPQPVTGPDLEGPVEINFNLTILSDKELNRLESVVDKITVPHRN